MTLLVQKATEAFLFLTKKKTQKLSYIIEPDPLKTEATNRMK